jgi:hypothetical protein
MATSCTSVTAGESARKRSANGVWQKAGSEKLVEKAGKGKTVSDESVSDNTINENRLTIFHEKFIAGRFSLVIFRW